MKNLITIEEAITIAKNRNDTVNMYQEYADAYEFFNEENSNCEGGSNCSFIVEKLSGKVLRWAEYFMDSARNIVEIGEPIKF